MELCVFILLYLCGTYFSTKVLNFVACDLITVRWFFSNCNSDMIAQIYKKLPRKFKLQLIFYFNRPYRTTLEDLCCSAYCWPLSCRLMSKMAKLLSLSAIRPMSLDLEDGANHYVAGCERSRQAMKVAFLVPLHNARMIESSARDTFLRKWRCLPRRTRWVKNDGTCLLHESRKCTLRCEKNDGTCPLYLRPVKKPLSYCPRHTLISLSS